MSTTLAATFPTANSNVQNTLDTATIQTVSKESDFFDLLTYASQRELANVKSKLEEAVRTFSNTRNPLVDLCRLRLNQIRNHLKPAI